MGNYIDNVVLKLQRKYSKDELVAHLNKEIEELKKQNSDLLVARGEDLSYIDELEDLKITSMKNGGEQWFKKYSEIKDKYDKLLNENEPYNNLKKGYQDLMNKYKELKSKNSIKCQE